METNLTLNEPVSLLLGGLIATKAQAWKRKDCWAILSLVNLTGKFLGRFRSIGVSLLLLNSGDYFQGLVLNLEMDSINSDYKLKS